MQALSTCNLGELWRLALGIQVEPLDATLAHNEDDRLLIG